LLLRHFWQRYNEFPFWADCSGLS